MSALREAMSHAVLGWVKPELDETLRLVRQEIESFVEAPADTSRMRFCAGYLHQVQGTLRMVELYAPAMVAEELELLAKALQDGGVGDRDEACATLMRGAVLLPDYLERLQEGHRDIPIVLLPLLNEIRAARGASGLNESMLFPGGASDEATPSEAEIDHARSSLSGRNRELLDTVGNAVKEELLRVKDALDLHLRTGNDAHELEPQVAELGNVADTLGMMGLGVARDVVMQQRDTLREVVAGNRPADEGTLLDVAGALLYVDASLDDQVARLGSAGDAGPDPSAAESQRTVEVLAQEAIINFAGARERFVAFIETNWDHGELADVPRLLDEVAGALRMLELGQAGDYVVGVRRYVSGELIGKKRVPGGQQLDTLADAMASLEYYLEALRERRPNREDILEITRGSLEALRYWPLPPEAPAAVEPATAAVAAVTGVAEAMVEPETTQVADAPAPIETAKEDAGASAFGALTLEPIDAAPALADANPFDPVGFDEARTDVEAATFVVDIENQEAAPLPVDASTEVEAEVEAEVEEVVEDVAPAASFEPEEEALPDLRHEIAAAAAALPTTAVVGGFDSDATDIDDEIREVFLEEFDEEIVNLRQLLPAWRSNPEDLERLRPIRRVFHTLKGSGRLVGAKTLGEFSWKIENMLNRVLDRTREPSHAVEALLELACDALPQLNAALRGQGSVTADLAGLQDVADRLAAGEEAYYSAQPTVVDEDAEFVEPAPAAIATPAIEDVPAVFEPETEGTPAAVDAVLREILEVEVDNHLDTVDTWLLKAQIDALPVTEELLRAVHTMNGALAMADVPEITDVTSAAEQYVKRLLAAGETPTPEGVSAIADTAQAIRRSVAALQAPSPRIPVFAALAGQLVALRDSLPEQRHGAQIVDDTRQSTYVEQMPTIAPPVTPTDVELAALDLSAYLDDTAHGAGGDLVPDVTVVESAAETATADSGSPVQPPQEVTFYDIDYRILPRAHAEAPGIATEGSDVEAASAAAGESPVEAPREEPVIEDALVVDADLPIFLSDTVEPTTEVAAPAEDAVVEDAVVEEPVAEEANDSIAVEEVAIERAATEEAVIEPAGAEEIAIEEIVAEDATEVAAPVEDVAAVDALAEDAAGEDAAAETAPVEEVVVEDAVVDASPVEDEAVVEEAVADEVAVFEAPADALETGETAEPEVVASAEAEESAVTSAPADMPEPGEALDLTGLDLDLVEIFIEEGNDL
ncbi:MAG TPA: Hpt domain-containing protein, partial [Pseudoxanthomonas sp.]